MFESTPSWLRLTPWRRMTTAVRKSRVDVLVIGAGPAGLMCATALAAAGIQVRIVDKRAQRVMIGHADGVMPRSLEVLQVRVT